MNEFLKELQGWACILTPIALVIGGFIIAFISSDANRKRLDSQKSQQHDQLAKKGVMRSAEYEWRNYMNTRYYRFIVDNINRKVYIESNSEGMIEIPFSKIIGFEANCDGLKGEGLYRPIIGAMTFGAIGAISGAMASKNKVRSFSADLYIQDVHRPNYHFSFIQKETSTKSSDYTSAVHFTEKVNATIRAIAAQNSTYQPVSTYETTKKNPEYEPTTFDELLEQWERVKNS